MAPCCPRNRVQTPESKLSCPHFYQPRCSLATAPFTHTICIQIRSLIVLFMCFSYCSHCLEYVTPSTTQTSNSVPLYVSKCWLRLSLLKYQLFTKLFLTFPVRSHLSLQNIQRLMVPPHFAFHFLKLNLGTGFWQQLLWHVNDLLLISSSYPSLQCLLIAEHNVVML